MAAAGAAATEAPPPESSSGDSYIGSLISLTSKSEIRYEGVLYNINPHDSTIGLKNVRSFGTEGRKRDGPVIPPSDKVYEFILFRGSDIKDLQVKSSPPVQTAVPTHTDPAIIQSIYSQGATPSVTKPPSSSGLLIDSSSHASPHGLSMPTYQGSLPLYQPGGNLGSWSSSTNPPTTSASGLAMPMYWQGYYGLSNGLQPQQQALLQTPPGLSMPPSIPQPQSAQYPAMNASKIPASETSGNPPLMLPSVSTGTQNMQFSPTVSDTASLLSNKASNQVLPTASVNIDLPTTSLLTTGLNGSFTSPPVINESMTVYDPVVPSRSMSESLSSAPRASSSVLNEGAMPSLVTPGDFLQFGPSTVPSLPSSQTTQKDVEVAQISSSESPPSTVPTMETQEPILPLPSPLEHKVHGASMHSYHGSRDRHERGRGNRVWDTAAKFKEDFDFTSMNEKFNKVEVWGHLGKNNKAQEGNDSKDEDDADLSKIEKKPVYVKDEFFDSLSCDSLAGGSRNGRPGYPGHFKRNTETFGDFSQHGVGGGGWGPGRGGRSRGGYQGRAYGYGYGYGGRGRGYYTMSSHGI